jgi:hypothetical protein
LGIDEKDVIEIMKKKLTADKFESGKRKPTQPSPNQNPSRLMILTKN